MKKSNYTQQKIFNILKQFSGTKNILAIPRFFIEITDDIEEAIVLSQLIYWHDKSVNDGWVYKTYKDWEEETGLSEYKVRKAKKKLEEKGKKEKDGKEKDEKGWIETKIKKANGNPTVHYRLTEKFFDDIVKLLEETKPKSSQERSLKNQRNVSEKIKETNLKNLKKPVTETTTETTTENIYIVENSFSTKDPPDTNKKPKKNENNGNDEINKKAKMVLKYLNERANRNFRKVNKHITARLREYDLIDLIDVIDWKVAEWGEDEKMKKYIRPETLFSAEHFDTYLDEANQHLLRWSFDNIYHRKILREQIKEAERKGWQLPKALEIHEWKEKGYERWRQKRVEKLLQDYANW